MDRTREQRRREIKRRQRDKLKAELKAKEKKQKERYNFPPFIKTLSNRLSRLDPWTGITKLDSWNCSLITYYKLKQYGVDELRFSVTQGRAWVEFKYNDEWWIFDPTAVSNKDLGPPIKREKYISVPIDKKLNVDQSWKFKNTVILPKIKTDKIIEYPEYNEMKRYFDDVDKYIDLVNDKLNYDKDEAKIAAMKDKVLSMVFRSHV